MLTLEKREKLHNKAVRIAERFTDQVQRDTFIDLVDAVVEEVYEVEREKSSRSELRELIIEMRELIEETRKLRLTLPERKAGG